MGYRRLFPGVRWGRVGAQQPSHSSRRQSNLPGHDSTRPSKMIRMKPVRAALLLALAAVLFLVANRAAYRGFFSGDDLDNIAWTRELPASDFVSGLLTPRYHLNHFRPAGHATFALLGKFAGLRFEWYVALVHLLHLATSVSLLLLLAKLGFSAVPAAAGAAFFAFQMAMFDALWKPMYLFDVWCALFSTLCLSAWVSGRLWWSLGFLWFAIKAKEHAVMIVGVLMLYELLLGERRWKRVAGAAAIAAIFAAQAVTANREQGEAYRLSFTLPALVQTLSFYSARVLVLPYLSLLLIPAVLWTSDRRAWWGIGSAILLLSPMLFLPGRMFPAYLYVPMLGIAIVAAALAARAGWRFTAAAGALWLLLNFQHLRAQRRAELAIAADSRGYFEQVRALASRHPGLRNFIYAGYPEGLQSWGVQGALRLAYQRLDLRVEPADSRNLAALFDAGPVGIVSWNPGTRKVSAELRQARQKDSSYIDIAQSLPVWQFGEGWYGPEGAYRWTKTKASATLQRPAGASAFELKVNIGEAFIARVKRSTVRVLLDGAEAGTSDFSDPGWHTVRFPLKPGAESAVTVEFHSSPGFRPGNDPRELGIAIGAFGFR